MSAIIQRLDQALAAAARHGPAEIRLDDIDRDRLDSAQSEAWGSKLHCFSYQDLQIFRGERSGIRCRDGSWFDLPAEAR